MMYESGDSDNFSTAQKLLQHIIPVASIITKKDYTNGITDASECKEIEKGQLHTAISYKIHTLLLIIT